MWQSKRIQQVSLLTLGLLALYVLFSVIKPFIMPLIAAVALAVLFHPLHGRISRWIRNPDLAAITSVFTVILLILVPTVWLGFAVTGEFRNVYHDLAQRSAGEGDISQLIDKTSNRMLEWAGVHSSENVQAIKDSAVQYAQEGATMVLNLAKGLVSNVAELVMSAVLVLFSLFYLFRDGKNLRQQITAILPIDETATQRLFTEISASVIANMYGIVAVAVVQGMLTGVLFFLVGFPSPVLWSLVAGLFSMVPLIGPPAVWGPAAFLLAVQGNYGKAAIVVAAGTLVIGMADNLIRPYVVSGESNTHPLLVFFAILGGVQAFGFLGLFIGPAVLSLTIAVFELLRGVNNAPAQPAEPPTT